MRIGEENRMGSEYLKVEQRGHVLEVTLDRPKANAIDNPTSRAMGEVFAAFRDDPSCRVAIVTGAGERFFSAGWDLKAVAAEGEDLDLDFGIGGWAGLQELPDLNKPVIAAINGMAVGGGFELALACDLLIAADHARFSLPEQRAGIMADAATITLPRRVPHHVAIDMLLTGRWMDASEAHRWGLVRSVVPSDEVLSIARELADEIASGPPLLWPAIKETVRVTEPLAIQEAFKLLSSGGVPSVVRLSASEDMLEGARAFAEKREPVWRGQ
jgi:crotonobetainyl-CoA hydratase